MAQWNYLDGIIPGQHAVFAAWQPWLYVYADTRCRVIKYAIASRRTVALLMDYRLSKYLLYYPVTFVKGEFIPFYLNRYRRFQWASESAIAAYQLNKLSELLTKVLSKNQFYRSLYANHGIVPEDIKTIDDLKRLPTITKQDLIKYNDQISSTKGFFASVKTTGGSTGEPVKLFKSAGALARERAATWRGYEWAGITVGDPQARLWGLPHSQKSRLVARLTDVVANRRRLSAFDITPMSMAEYYKELQKFKPAYVYGYVSAIEAFADYVLDNNLPASKGLKCVITTSEVLSASARHRIESAFGVRVYNEYGCGEVGSIAHECEHGRMHVMADNLVVEVDSDGNSSGEIIVTDLFNVATPIIRYRLGDFATRDIEPCPCGRKLPIIESIHGRAYDLIKLPSGKKMHPEAVIYVFEGIQQRLGIFRQFQAIQTDQDRILIKLVPASDISSDDIRQLVFQLEKYIAPDIHFDIEICEKIDREKSGKMRVVKSLL